MNGESVNFKEEQQPFSFLTSLMDGLAALFLVDLRTGSYQEVSAKGALHGCNGVLLAQGQDFFADFSALNGGAAPAQEEILQGLARSSSVEIPLRMPGEAPFRVRFLYHNPQRESILAAFLSEKAPEESNNQPGMHPDCETKQLQDQIRETRTLINHFAAAYRIACRLSMKDGSFSMLGTDEEVLSLGRTFPDFPKARAFFIDTYVYPEDRDMVRKMLSYDSFREKTAANFTYKEEFRVLSPTGSYYCELAVINVGDDNIALGLKNKNREILLRHFQQETFDDYYALFLVDLNDGTLEIIKKSPWDDRCQAGEHVPYEEMIAPIARNHIGETREFFDSIGDIDGLKKMACKQDSVSYCYRSNYVTGAKWVTATVRVVTRNQDRVPSVVMIGFARMDESNADRHALMNELKASMTIVSAISADFVTMYTVDLDRGTYIVNRMSEESGEIAPIVENSNSYSQMVKAFFSSKYIHPEDMEKMLRYADADYVKSVLRGTSSANARFRRNYSGRWRWCEMQLLKANQADEEAHEIVVAFSYRDEEVAREMELQRSRQVAEKSERLIENLTARFDFSILLNMRDGSFKSLRKNGNNFHWMPKFRDYKEAARFFVKELVTPSDRDRMSRELSVPFIRMNLCDASTYSLEFRTKVYGVNAWYEMTVMNVDKDTVAMGFQRKDEEIVYRKLFEKTCEDHFALFVVDLETEQIRVIKSSPFYKVGEPGEFTEYSEAIQEFAATQTGEAQDFFMRLSDINFVRDSLQTEDKRTYTYKSSLAKSNSWVTVSCYVLQRDNSGNPVVVTLGFSMLDAMARDHRELQVRLHQDMQLISGLASGYLALYFVNMDEGSFKVYSLDGKRLPDTKEMVSKGGDSLALLRQFSHSNAVHPDDCHLFDEITVESVRKKLAHAKRFNVRFRRNYGGEYLWSEMDVIKAEGIDERPNAITIGFAERDEEVRRQQEYQEQLSNALQVAETANRSKTSFLFNMSHDIRTPMNAISGFTELAKKNVDNPEKIKDYLHKIDISCEQLLALINQVLEMSRIESGKVELEMTPVYIPNAFDSSVTVLCEQARTNGLVFSSSLLDIVHKDVLADQARMGQITLNLAGNAIKYTPRGGRIDFSLKEIPCEREGYARYCFTVSDTGIGMSKEYQAHLFEPFSREKTSTVSHIQGTGLGMSIVKNLVEMMDGTITVESELGKGTCFRVVVDLKIAPDGERAAKSLPVHVPHSFDGMRILLVEDNEMNREIAGELLTDQGFEVEMAEDGDVAVEMIRKTLEAGNPTYYNLVLMDIQMPHMNGYEATMAIRSMMTGIDPRLPIIAMTANAFEEDRKKALASGMDDHFAKPINIGKLLETLAKFI